MSNTLKKSTDNQKTTPNSSATPSPSSNTASSSSSSATKEDKKTVQVIIGEIGRDTKTGILGRGYSFDNGKTFHVLDTMYGRLYGSNDIDAIWKNGASERVKSEVNSATAEIPAVKSNTDKALQRADEAIKQSTTNSEAIININSAASAAKSDANVALQNAVADFNKEKSANQSAYAALHSSVASNQADIDSTSKSLDGLSTNLKQYAQNAVSQGKTIAELKQNQSDVSATVASVEGNVNQLKVDTKNIQATASDNKSDIANLQISASSASVAIKDANSNAAVAVATASQSSVELQDAKSNIAAVQATAEGLQGTVANAQSDINQVKADAKGIHEQITNANSQIATINTNVNGLQTSVSQVTSSVNDVSKTAQANKTAIDQNTKAIALKANQTSVDDLNKTISSQTASLTVMNNAISTKVTSADVEKAIDGKGYVTKDFVESTINQSADKINESISNLNGDVQNVTKTVDGIQSTVKSKVDQSQLTQLNNLISTKVNQDDYKSAITQLGDDINARVQKGDLISQINLEAGQTLIESKKLFLDADSVVFSGKAFIPDAAIAHLSLDKLTVGHITVPIADKYGNQIELGNDGINIISGLVVEDSTNSDSNSSDSNVSDMTTVSTGELTNLAASPATALNTALFIDNQPNNTGTISNQPDNPNSSSSASSSAGSVSSGSDSDSFQKIGYGVKLTANGLKMYQHRQYAKTTGAEPKSEDFTLLDVNPIKSPASNDSKKLPEGLAFMIQTQKYSSVLGPETPHNFLALGRKYYNDANDYTGTDFYDVVYSAEDGNGYNVGLHVNTSLYTKPYGADHGIRTAWVSWSNWDNGEKYPAIVNDTTHWGGICFPKSGVTTIFDAYGKYSIPDKDTGHGPYSGYGG